MKFCRAFNTALCPFLTFRTITSTVAPVNQNAPTFYDRREGLLCRATDEAQAQSAQSASKKADLAGSRRESDSFTR